MKFVACCGGDTPSSPFVAISVIPRHALFLVIKISGQDLSFADFPTDHFLALIPVIFGQSG
jgi:hypothetical protein